MAFAGAWQRLPQVGFNATAQGANLISSSQISEGSMLASTANFDLRRDKDGLLIFEILDLKFKIQVSLARSESRQSK
jgi:hypothetical protein